MSSSEIPSAMYAYSSSELRYRNGSTAIENESACSCSEEAPGPSGSLSEAPGPPNAVQTPRATKVKIPTAIPTAMGRTERGARVSCAGASGVAASRSKVFASSSVGSAS